VGEPEGFGKSTRDLAVDIDQRGDAGAALVADDDRIADHRGRAQMIFDELRRISLPALKPADVFEPIEEDQLAVVIEPDSVAGPETFFGIAKLRGGGGIVEIA